VSKNFHIDCEWLLQGEPWVTYNTLKTLLEMKEDAPEVRNAKKTMIEHPLVKAFIAELKEWPLYPLKRHNDAKHPIHHLAVLADFGITIDDLGTDIIQRILSYQSDEGAFETDLLIPTHFGGSGNPERMWMACDAPLILYSLLKMGVNSPEIQRAVTHLGSLITDTGVLCTGSSTMRGPGRKDDFCPYATLLVAKALTQIPKMKNEAEKCTEMLLYHWEHQKERKLYLFGIGTDFRKLKYPFVWYDILHVADVLSQFDFLKDDDRLKEIVDIIVSKQDENGLITPESVWLAFKEWDFGQKKVASPWMTFLVARILKRIYG
jgi:hypothetical protein